LGTHTGCTDATDACTPEQTGELTPQQFTAIDLLANGWTDAATAEKLKVHRTTVARWRLHSEPFRAELAARRANLWGASADQLRSLLPRALAVLSGALNEPYTRVDVALALLKLARGLPLAPDPADTSAPQKTDPEPAPAKSESAPDAA
jgi:hypothetical protein